jgi:hypothetical protein
MPLLIVLLLILVIALQIVSLIQQRRIMSTTGSLPQDVLDLQAAVGQETTVEQSAIALLQGLSAQLTAALASGNPVAAVEAVVTSMNTNQTALAAAVVANTPASAPVANAAKKA